MLVCVFVCAFCTRDRGCSAHPVFLRPPISESGTSMAKLARNMRRDREAASGECALESEWSRRRSELPNNYRPQSKQAALPVIGDRRGLPRPGLLHRRLLGGKLLRRDRQDQLRVVIGG